MSRGKSEVWGKHHQRCLRGLVSGSSERSSGSLRAEGEGARPAGGGEVREVHLPHPRSLFDVEEPTQTVHWHQRPATGQLSGLLFLDGSAKYMGLDGLARAVWGIVSVD
eukprot:5879134-Pyramimonas_sp.AAC.1